MVNDSQESFQFPVIVDETWDNYSQLWPRGQNRTRFTKISNFRKIPNFRAWAVVLGNRRVVLGNGRRFLGTGAGFWGMGVHHHSSLVVTARPVLAKTAMTTRTRSKIRSLEAPLAGLSCVRLAYGQLARQANKMKRQVAAKGGGDLVVGDVVQIGVQPMSTEAG